MEDEMNEHHSTNRHIQSGEDSPQDHALGDALGDASDAVTGQRRRLMDGGHDPRELAQRRWEKQRARQAAADAQPAVDADDMRIVKTPIRISKIISALEGEAARGNAQAAKELRAWLADYPPKDDAVKVEDLDRLTRERILARLLAEIEEEETALGNK
jgi:hypothetical protein